MTPGTPVRVGPCRLPGTVTDVAGLQVRVEFDNPGYPPEWIDAENVEVRQVEDVGQEGLF